MVRTVCCIRQQVKWVWQMTTMNVQTRGGVLHELKVKLTEKL